MSLLSSGGPGGYSNPLALLRVFRRSSLACLRQASSQGLPADGAVRLDRSFLSPDARQVRAKALDRDNDLGFLLEPLADVRQALPLGNGSSDLRPKGAQLASFCGRLSSRAVVRGGLWSR